MKTQIITLESHDDLISVRDRMSWGKSRRVLLVWPGFENVALRPVDLRMLQQHARYLGAELGLVTRRGEIRREAEGFGIPVFHSPAEAQRRAWPEAAIPARRRRIEGSAGAESLRAMRDEVRARAAGGRTNVAVRFGSFAIGVLAVLVLAGLFVPRATIVLTPVSQEQEVTLPVKASPEIKEVAISGSLPAHVLSVEVSGTQSGPVASTAAIPQDKALGIVEFKNLTQTEILLPAGTVVYSVTPSSARFETQSEARLMGTVNALVDVPIEAVQAGAKGNMPANSIQAVEGPLGTSVAVTNLEPTVGGSDKKTTVPNAADRGRVRQALVAALQSQAADELRAMIGVNDLLMPDTLQAGQIAEETYDPAAGDPGATLNLRMSMEFQAQYIKAGDLKTVAEAALAASAPAGYVPSPGSLIFGIGNAAATDQSGISQFDLKVKCRLVHVLDLDQAAVMVRGVPPSVAGALLRSRLPLDRPPEVQMSPAWWPWLPLIPFRITVTTA